MDIVWYTLCVVWGYCLANGICAMMQFNKGKSLEQKLFGIKLATFGRKDDKSDEETATLLSFFQTVGGFLGLVALVIMVFKFNFDKTLLYCFGGGMVIALGVYFSQKPKEQEREDVVVKTTKSVPEVSQPAVPAAPPVDRDFDSMGRPRHSYTESGGMAARPAVPPGTKVKSKTGR